MQIKEISPIQTLVFTTQTTLNTMVLYVGNVAEDLFKEAQNLNLDITGSIFWIYTGADGKPDTEFKLEIALPVKTEGKKSEKFSYKLLEPFKCVSKIHNGAWDKMNETYCNLFPEFYRNGHQFSGICRELYLTMDFETPEKNVTEIQVGMV